tara:strand:+ start:8278 stop:8931 length:654 start_codon:yes stop_codon:yes gene_type:complete
MPTDFEYSITPLFSIPLFSTEIKDITKEELEYVKNTEYKRFPVDNGYGSVSKYLLDEQPIASLKNKIDHVVKTYLYDILKVNKEHKFEMTESWSVKHIKGDESGSHRHANSMLSGVLYLQTDETSGDIWFHKDPNTTTVFTPTVDVTFTEQNLFNSQIWAVRPKSNTLILFPSTMFHSVAPSQSDIERYVVAFNYFAFGDFGHGNNLQLSLKNNLNK